MTVLEENHRQYHMTALKLNRRKLVKTHEAYNTNEWH